MQIFKQLEDKLTTLADSLASNNKLQDSIPTTTTQKSSTKLDYNKIHNAMLQEYTRALLTKLKDDLASRYLKLREQEKNHTPHTNKHKELTAELHRITTDIDKIQQELDASQTCTDNIVQQIKNDLNLLSTKK